jgi:hypothetical protein
MKRTLILTGLILAGWLGLDSVSQAQVFIRAPLVRVWVGDGVGVRAPFVNVYVPPSGPVYGPRVIYMPAPVVVQGQPAVVQPAPPASDTVPVPAPKPLPPSPSNAPPQPIQPVQVQSIDAFAKSFQPKAGSYEVTLLNPVTNQPTTVRFTLPEGTPRRVIITRDSLEFIYGLRQWVRIEFERDGVRVTSR